VFEMCPIRMSCVFLRICYVSTCHVHFHVVVSVQHIHGVWIGLCGYILSGHEDDICADPGVISIDIPMTIASVGYQEYLKVFLMKRFT